MGEDNLIVNDELLNTARVMDCEILYRLILDSRSLHYIKDCLSKDTAYDGNYGNIADDVIKVLNSWLSLEPTDEVVSAIIVLKQTLEYLKNGVKINTDMVSRMRAAIVTIYDYIDKYYQSILTAKTPLILTCRVEEVSKAVTALDDYAYADIALLNSYLMRGINSLATTTGYFSAIAINLSSAISTILTKYDVYAVNKNLRLRDIINEYDSAVKDINYGVQRLVSSTFSGINKINNCTVVVTPDTPRADLSIKLSEVMTKMTDSYELFIDKLMKGLESVYSLDSTISNDYDIVSDYQFKESILSSKLHLDWCITLLTKQTDAINDSVVKLSKTISIDDIDGVDVL